MIKISKYNLFLFLVLLFMFSCKTIKKNQSFSIGKGGGFTGKYENYRIDYDGRIYHLVSDNQIEFLKKLDKKITKDIFNKFSGLNITEIVFSHPGNMTSYIAYEKNGKTYEIKWGDHRVKPPQNIIEFFDFTWNIIKSR